MTLMLPTDSPQRLSSTTLPNTHAMEVLKSDGAKDTPLPGEIKMPPYTLQHSQSHIYAANRNGLSIRQSCGLSQCGASISYRRVSDFVFANDGVILIESLEDQVMALEALH